MQSSWTFLQQINNPQTKDWTLTITNNSTMRRCLSCCSLPLSTILIGLVWLITASLLLVPLISILSGVHFEGFMFKQNLELFEQEIQSSLPRYNWTEGDPVHDVLLNLPNYTPYTIMGGTVYCGLVVLESALLIAGVRSKTGLLIIPFLFHTFVDLLLFVALGGLISAGLFHLGLVPGIMATVAFVVSGTIFFNLWRIVLSFYNDMSQPDEEGLIYQKTIFLPASQQQFDLVESDKMLQEAKE